MAKPIGNDVSPTALPTKRIARMPTAGEMLTTLDAIDVSDERIRTEYFAPLTRVLGERTNLSYKSVTAAIVGARTAFLRGFGQRDQAQKMCEEVLALEDRLVEAVVPVEFQKAVDLGLAVDAFNRLPALRQTRALNGASLKMI